MNGVIGMTNLLADTPLNPLQREYLETIRNSGEHLLAVINDVLDFSKADADKLDLEHYSFSLRSCMEEAMDLVAQQAARKHLELVLDAPLDLPARVSGDAGRLRQVLVNLLSNAIKFTEAGEVVVTARVQADDAAADHWRLQVAVRDTGIGIPENRMDRLFQMFSQVDASHTRTHGGTGLGLAICRKLVERMNGRIWAESQAGIGSTFRFDVVLGRVAEARSSVRDPHPLRGRSALIVDDNPTNLRVLRGLLESWGMAVTECSGPVAALQVVETRGFDVALVDFMMPDMTGHQLAGALSGLERGQTLPLILLGSVSEAEQANTPSLFKARLLKPVRQSTLYDQLALLFDLRGEVATPDEPKVALLGESLRVLVAEDNIVNQKVAQRFLERLGHQVDIVNDGQEAVNAATRHPYDVILMDVQMPVMDGFEATREIRTALSPGPRIIAVTANALAGDEQRCRDAGMDDYLSKPLNPRALATALDRTLLALNRQASQQPAEPETAPAATPLPNDFRQEGFDQLIELFEQDGAEELIAALVKDLTGQSADLARALDEQDAVVLGRVAHTLKSTSRLVGADALGDLCETIELQCRNGDLHQAKHDANIMIQRYGALVSRLTDRVGLP